MNSFYLSEKRRSYNFEILTPCVKEIQKAGVILRALPGDIIGFCPPLIINQKQINEMFDKIDKRIKSFEDTARALMKN